MEVVAIEASTFPKPRRWTPREEELCVENKGQPSSAAVAPPRVLRRKAAHERGGE